MGDGMGKKEREGRPANTGGWLLTVLRSKKTRLNDQIMIQRVANMTVENIVKKNKEE